ncbi:4-phosphoerythronate dehydrogenase (FAD-dependent) [Litorimonas taeanensis]|uniref:4-phosphoerythronate dehydrogenase (FAD-dependent) n=1 Tax=Litorimonas taeanensis TaxID=568099 RepID=A0A420WIL0_9PROT|nr:FAD-binding oxidoreductase [Litorimonas taeanensis]RKQ70843.1 4-phosphoerythronate dehydrogenase (FAD-dependent) [Litorimonas taeanensis]
MTQPIDIPVSKIEILKSELPKNCWTQDIDIIAPHLTEWRDKYFGKTPLMLTPRCTQDVSDAVKLCAEHRISIMPQGGNTGLVGGNTPMGEVLITLKHMTRIREINTTANSLIVEAGAVLQNVLDAADAENRKFPMTLSSQGSCTVGGVLSTNAGGNHVLKYGTTKELVFGVEAVLPNGDIFNGLTNLRKDNTGYDLNRLFLGAEGTLGIITAASLKLFPKPKYVQRALIGLDSVEAAISLLEDFRAGGRLAMFEVMPAIGYHAVIDGFDSIRDPFDTSYAWYLLCDWEVESEAEGMTLAENILGKAFEAKKVLDAVIAQNETQAADILSIREHMSAGQKFLGGSVKHDITVPIDKIPEFFRLADAKMQEVVPGCRPVGFGHFGDGNIHYNIAQPEGADKKEFLANWDALSQPIFDICDALGGSISAEHGIGTMKFDDLAQRASPTKYALLKAIKRAIDPERIMNPRVMV